jgi:hypothetical protein
MILKSIHSLDKELLSSITYLSVVIIEILRSKYGYSHAVKRQSIDAITGY